MSDIEVFMKPGQHWLYEKATGDIIGFRDPDGDDIFFPRLNAARTHLIVPGGGTYALSSSEGGNTAAIEALQLEFELFKATDYAILRSDFDTLQASYQDVVLQIAQLQGVIGDTRTEVDGVLEQTGTLAERVTSLENTTTTHGQAITANHEAIQLAVARIETLEDATTTPPPANQPPTFTKAPNKSVNESTQTTLTATNANDPEGKAVTYLWAQQSGTACTGISGTTTATVTFTTPAVNANEDIVWRCTVSDPDGGSTSQDTTVTVVDVPATTFETTFNSDSAYASWSPVSNTTILSRTSRSAPAKSGSITSGGYIDSQYGTRVRRVTVDTERTAGSNLRHSYSKQRVFNANNTRFLTRGGGRWFLYDANTLQMLNGRNPSTPNAVWWEHPDYGSTGVMQEGGVDATWDTTNPNVCYYGGNNESTSSPAALATKWMKRTFNADGSGTSELMYDFQPVVDRIFGTGTYPVRCVSMHGDGRPSDDCRYWPFIAKHRKGSRNSDSRYQWCRGFFIWDNVDKKVCGYFRVPNGDCRWFDGINIAHDGSYVVVQHVGYTSRLSSTYNLPASGATRSTAYADFTGPCTENLGRGVFAFKRIETESPFDVNDGFCVTVDAEHGDMAKTADGKPVYVQKYYDAASYDGFPSNWAGSIMCMIIDSNKGATLNTHYWGYPGLTSYGNGADGSMHFSGCGFKRPGWIAYNMHQSPGGVHIAGTVGVIELRPTNPRVLRLGWHYSGSSPDGGAYWGEPHACANNDLTRIMFASTFGGTTPACDYVVCLPSNGIPTALAG